MTYKELSERAKGKADYFIKKYDLEGTEFYTDGTPTGHQEWKVEGEWSGARVIDFVKAIDREQAKEEFKDRFRAMMTRVDKITKVERL